MEQQARWPDVPPCYRFTPTARELIRYYLNPWVANPGQTPFGEPEGVVCAADVYSADPGTLASRLRRFGHDDGNWYFLCVARWKDGNAGTRMTRAVRGGGTWHESGKRIAVRHHGYRQTFEYRENKVIVLGLVKNIISMAHTKCNALYCMTRHTTIC